MLCQGCRAGAGLQACDRKRDGCEFDPTRELSRHKALLLYINIIIL